MRAPGPGIALAGATRSCSLSNSVWAVAASRYPLSRTVISSHGSNSALDKSLEPATACGTPPAGMINDRLGAAPKLAGR